MIPRAGILATIWGAARRPNALLLVLAAGFAAGAAAGMSFNQIVGEFGRRFVENRYLTMPVALMLPLVGLLERHGLRERAADLIGRARGATAGRVLLLYTAARQISIALGVNIGGHAGAVRPLIAPMAEGAARARHGELSAAASELIRAHAALAENVGNFFGEDVFVAVGAVLLMKGFFEGVGVPVGVWPLALWGIPTAGFAFGLMWWRARTLDRLIEGMEAKPAARP